MAPRGMRTHYEWHAVRITAERRELVAFGCVSPFDVLDLIDHKREALGETWTGELWRVVTRADGGTESIDVAPFTFDAKLPERWVLTQRTIPDKLHYKLSSAKRRYTKERQRIDRATAQ